MTNRELAFEIPPAELAVRATRSSGAGGQHVNKTSSRVQMSWDVAASVALDESQRERVRRKLASRLTDDGVLTVNVSDTRSQHRNREIAAERINDIVRKALAVPKKRKATRPTRAAREARLDSKKLHSRKKQNRRADTLD
jgi:ribosome-associated protein